MPRQHKAVRINGPAFPAASPDIAARRRDLPAAVKAICLTCGRLAEVPLAFRTFGGDDGTPRVSGHCPAPHCPRCAVDANTGRLPVFAYWFRQKADAAPPVSRSVMARRFPAYYRGGA